MEKLNQLRAWLDDHKDLGYDLMRIYLGVGLFAKGVYFLSDQQFLTDILKGTGSLDFAGSIFIHYIALAHLFGGLCMAIGLLTRVAALIQIPILIGAIALVHLGEGLFSRGQTLEFSLLVLFLLVLTAMYGAGRYSLEYFLFQRKSQMKASA
jgi:uncharacterized membrane protein YphA (DoxX/SURF4 family)